MSVGERIAEERKRLGMSQEAFAKHIGVSFSSQRRYESDDRTPNIRYIAALEKSEIDVAYVMTGSRSPQDRIGYYATLDRQTAELLVLLALQIDMDGFASALHTIEAEKNTPEFLSKVLDAIIDNSPPLQERLHAPKPKRRTDQK